jgi:hypothetical protein
MFTAFNFATQYREEVVVLPMNLKQLARKNYQFVYKDPAFSFRYCQEITILRGSPYPKPTQVDKSNRLRCMRELC